MPSADAISATRRPMLPTPIKPRVAPASFARTYPGSPHRFLPPDMLVLQCDGLRNFLGQREKRPITCSATTGPWTSRELVTMTSLFTNSGKSN